MTQRAIGRAQFAGAAIDVIALAAVRATREATVAHGRNRLPSIVGTPIAGETAGGEAFDGLVEAAMFPGDLPEDAEALFSAAGGGFKGLTTADAREADYRFLSFRPPPAEKNDGAAPLLPQIRLDRALQFLLGDRLA